MIEGQTQVETKEKHLRIDSALKALDELCKEFGEFVNKTRHCDVPEEACTPCHVPSLEDVLNSTPDKIHNTIGIIRDDIQALKNILF